jgi:hypothetical protein
MPADNRQPTIITGRGASPGRPFPVALRNVLQGGLPLCGTGALGIRSINLGDGAGSSFGDHLSRWQVYGGRAA